MGVSACDCCGREFGSPLRLTILSQEPEETYFACPFCFTKVKEIEAETIIEPIMVKKQERVRGKRSEKNIGAGVLDCGHQLGYLKGRAKNAAIPDECLICPKILECMI